MEDGVTRQTTSKEKYNSLWGGLMKSLKSFKGQLVMGWVLGPLGWVLGSLGWVLGPLGWVLGQLGWV